MPCGRYSLPFREAVRDFTVLSSLTRPDLSRDHLQKHRRRASRRQCPPEYASAAEFNALHARAHIMVGCSACIHVLRMPLTAANADN